MRGFATLLYPKSDTQALLTDKSPADFASLRRILGNRGGIHPFFSLREAIHSYDEFMQKTQARAHFNFFTDLLPHIHSWALSYDTPLEIPLLEAGLPSKVPLTRGKIRTLLSNAFFLNVLSLRDAMSCEKRQFGDISLIPLYTSTHELAKQRILCLLAYFTHALQLQSQDDDEVCFERHVLQEAAVPNWSSLDVKIDVNHIRIHTEWMENSDATGFMDFANKALHIHTIIPSATQEEILFSACPEAFVGVLISEEMQDTEVMIIRNVRRLIEYEGYSSTFRFAGFYPTTRVHDIVVADATPVMHFTKAMIDRDLNKAYLAFAAASSSSSMQGVAKISTSHWGCGAFGGDKHLKFLQQVCASTLAGVSLDYSTFGDSHIASSFNHLLGIIGSKHHTIESVYDAMSGFEREKGDFFDHVVQNLGKSNQ